MRICPTCGDRCAQAWCGFCERALPHPDSPFPRIEDTSATVERLDPAAVASALGASRGSCGMGTCTDPACWICVGMQAAFRVVRCPEINAEGERCKFVARHRGPCQAGPRRRKKQADGGLYDEEAD